MTTNGINNIVIKTNSCYKLAISESKELKINYCCKETSASKENCECVDTTEIIEKNKGLTMISPGLKDDTNGYNISIIKKGGTLIFNDLNTKVIGKCIKYKIPEGLTISAGN